MKRVRTTPAQQRVQYKPGEETYGQRQLREFFNPPARTIEPVAPGINRRASIMTFSTTCTK